MSFTRLHDDTCRVSREDNQSKSILSYVTDVGRFEHTQKCYQPNGMCPAAEVRESAQTLVDVDSEVKGIFLSNTKCPDKKFQPNKTLVRVDRETGKKIYIDSGSMTKVCKPAMFK